MESKIERVPMPRSLQIVFAYVAACFVAGLVIPLAGTATGALMNGSVSPFVGHLLEKGALAVLILLPVAFLLGIYVAILAFVPALAVVAYAERARVRSPLFYMAAGAVIGVGTYALYWLVLFLSVPAGTAANELVAAACSSKTFLGALGLFGIPGLVAGLVYWLIAGRHALLHARLTL